MRTVKEAAVRRNEILDAAEKLFGTKGYDATSTADILQELGIARGTLYYHFKSKEDILDAMIDRVTRTLAARAAEVLDRKDIPVLQRLTLMMQSLQVNNALVQEIMSQVHKPQNALMHQKMQERMLTAVVPLVTSLLQEAQEQGLCQTRYPEEVAEMTLLYSTTVFDELSGLSDEKRQEKVLAFICNKEKVSFPTPFLYIYALHNFPDQSADNSSAGQVPILPGWRDGSTYPDHSGSSPSSVPEQMHPATATGAVQNRFPWAAEIRTQNLWQFLAA